SRSRDRLARRRRTPWPTRGTRRSGGARRPARTASARPRCTRPGTAPGRSSPPRPPPRLRRPRWQRPLPTRSSSWHLSSAILFGLPDHRLLIEPVDLVDQLVGEHVLDVHAALNQALLPVERVESGPLRGRRRAPPRVLAVVDPLGLEPGVEDAE